MKRSSRSGFTIIEVLIAIVILTIGVLALASSSGTITRMMYFGQRKTDASALAQSVLDSMRYRANATSPKCTALASGTPGVSKPGFTVSTTVATSAGGDAKDIVVTVNYRVGTTAKTETISSTILCL
jgi:type IV pilus modification protein PilV